MSESQTVQSYSRPRNALPRRIKIAAVISSRYAPGTRPTLWDQRASGIEVIRAEDGEEINLFSNGGQSSPAPGWELLLLKDRVNPSATEAPQPSAVLWTLYGLPAATR